MPPETFDPTKSHIRDGDAIFQVLNADGTDWDEAATRAAYETWLAAQDPSP
jgi:hypothetical protein